MRFGLKTLTKLIVSTVILSSASSKTNDFPLRKFTTSDSELTWRDALKLYGGQWAWSCYEHGYGISTKCCCKTFCSWNKEKQLLVRHNETVYQPFGASYSDTCAYQGPVKWKRCYKTHFDC